MKWLPVLTVSIFCLTGCKVGPNYHQPCVDLPEIFVEDQPEKTFLVEDEDLVQWWSIFNDPFLNDLLDTAINNNFDYRIALEQVYQARSQFWIQFTQILPELDASFTATHYRQSQAFIANEMANAAGTGISPIQNFFQISMAALWEIDLFGKLRRAAAASYDLWQASVAETRAVKIVIITEIINTYTLICAYQKKYQLALDLIHLDTDLLNLILDKAEAGLAQYQDVMNAKAALEADEAQLSFIEAALKQYIYSMSILLGQLPETVITEFQVERPIPISQNLVPISVPSELLRRRPDITFAERQLAAATEQIGVAIADLFPSVSLTGSSSSFAANPLQGANVGYSTDRFKQLFTSSSLIWGIGAFVSTPVFDFGKRKAAVNVQISLRRQAYLAYQKTVIAALQETEQALQAYFKEQNRLSNLSNEVAALHEILMLNMDLFESGLADYNQVIVSKEAWIASLNTMIDSQQTLTSDLTAVYKALGGNW